MGIGFRCVLGQLFTGYTDGLDELFPDAIDSDDLYHRGKWHGFSLPQHERRATARTLDLSRWTDVRVFTELTETWRQVIVSRRSGEATSATE